MKNLFLIPTPAETRVAIKSDGFLFLTNHPYPNSPKFANQNIYITNDEKPKEGDWSLYQNKIHKCIEDIVGDEFKKIILTTDQDLIKDGVQPINDEFLEWFVNNPSCEEIEINVKKIPYTNAHPTSIFYNEYKIIIPKEEPKQTDEKGNPLTYWGGLEEPKQEYEYIGECKGNDGNGCFMDNPAHNCGCFVRKPKQETQGYICPETKKQCDDECCVSAEDCHTRASIGILSEPKQETLEEAAERCFEEMKVLNPRGGIKEFIRMAVNFGAKCQQEQDKNKYSEEEVKHIVSEALQSALVKFDLEQWFKQFIKKSV